MAMVDTLLAACEARGTPVRVALIGAGATGRMIALQLLTPVPGIRLVAIANRTARKAVDAFTDVGCKVPIAATSLAAVEDCIERGLPCVVDDPRLVCEAANVDVIIEATGTVEFGAHVVTNAIRHRKHVVLVNAELDSTLGVILKFQADRAGVVITNTDGDEPGVAMSLLRYLRSLGLRPVAAGNLKGMIDHYRTPDTQREFAAKHNQAAAKVTSFADGTKLAMESTILANATGFKIAQRGMLGPRCTHIGEMVDLLPSDKLLAGGIIDYALGAAPHTGAFVLVYEDDARKRKELGYYKMGDGPFYAFYTPFHLPHIQIASSIGRAALCHDATVTPIGAAVCEVATISKKDLTAGETLDGVGGFTAYGLIENSATFEAQHLLPMGIAEGCRLVRPIRKDQLITYDDVQLPEGRLCDELRFQQTSRFSAGT
jgi:predicted homoserine dehydrogenase-like protein